MNQLLESVAREIKARGLLRRGQRILVAVSGGVDSMVLLHILHGLSNENRWKLVVAHFNHNLRGRSSDADERLVQATAKRLGLRCISGKGEVRKIARQRKLSIEMAARELRHEFLARTAARLKIPTVALAHHSDDQVELFFLRLLRGSGGDGISGMKWRNPSPADSKIELTRPLLNLAKAELRKFASENKIAFREDRTNLTGDFQRNRIRNELLPLLKKRYQPSIDKTILRVMQITGTESELVSDLARDWFEAKRRTVFDALPVAVQRRVLRLQLIDLAIEPDFDLIERLRCFPTKAVSVGNHQFVRRESSGEVATVSVSRKSGGPPEDANQQKLSLSLDKLRSGSFDFSGARISWKLSVHKSGRCPRFTKGCEWFDADKIGRRIVLRHWEPGDRFQPIGMKVSVKLQDLFTNQKVPREYRSRVVVATTSAGELFWVEGLRISERFKLNPDTSRLLKWEWNH